jgi:hypothetical protein
MCLPLSAAAAATAAPAAAFSSSEVTAPKIPYGPRQESAHTTYGVHLRYPHLLHAHLCVALDVPFHCMHKHAVALACTVCAGIHSAIVAESVLHLQPHVSGDNSSSWSWVARTQRRHDIRVHQESIHKASKHCTVH